MLKLLCPDTSQHGQQLMAEKRTNDWDTHGIAKCPATGPLLKMSGNCVRKSLETAALLQTQGSVQSEGRMPEHFSHTHALSKGKNMQEWPSSRKAFAHVRRWLGAPPSSPTCG
jgi:hypothetical protein